ncbi:nephrin-like isoform X2 [Macrobrachium nipponense]|uniref:nephrin-like isoform X2 n=1 Tax=Macrobrachium nipponense TaxID=159736 RepID=UPI0030C8C343
MTPQVMKATWTTSSRSIRLVSAVFLSWILLLNGLGSCSGYQSFREVPESVQVKEGQDVFLRCAVDGQQGKVQWTKDGFALGFERHVPGYPRYAYSGDPSRGEHHLLINGVTLTEDGEYQCQVGPTDASPAIWAAANVTVLIPPRRLSITNWSDGGTIQVVGGNSLSLECVVSGGRPPATVWWYLGNTNLLTDQVIEEMDAPSVPRRWNVRSKVDLRVEAKDDRKTLSCEAEHPAFRDTAQGLSASLTLSVLHPPGLPVITGYKKGQIFREGERQNLSCRAPGGNPKPRVVWRREGRPVDANSTFVDSVGVVNTYSMVPTKEDDGVQYECVVGHELLEEPLSANITLTVYCEYLIPHPTSA